MSIEGQPVVRPRVSWRAGVPVFEIGDEQELQGLDATEPIQSADRVTLRRLVIDLCTVSDLGNAAVIALCVALHHLRACGVTTAIAGLDTRTRAILATAGVDVGMCDTVRGALRSIEQRDSSPTRSSPPPSAR